MADATGEDRINLSRRQAMAALGVGAVALTATHLGVAYEATQLAQQAPSQQIEELNAEIEKLKGLIALYENLERIGVDAVIDGALTVYKGFLDTLRGGVGLLQGGVGAAEGALGGFQNALALIHGALKAAEEAVANVAALFHNIESLLGDVTAPARPLLEQIRQFFDDLLSKIPFGVGDNIRRTINGIVGLVVAIPSMISSVSTGLLEPLRTGWFSDDAAKNIQGTLLDPITQQVLTPLKKFLGDVDQTLAHWENDVSTPVRAALDQRQLVRDQIKDYRTKNKMS
jgi:hypothetical protein